MRNKKALILLWNSFNNVDTVNGLKALGFECDFMDIRGSKLRDESYADRMTDFLKKHRGEFDIVYSTNYYSYLAASCSDQDIPYIAWNYDSPWGMDGDQYLAKPTTHVFTFDRDEAGRFKEKGFNNVQYLALAIDTDRCDRIQCSHSDKKKYKSQGSFVGQLYSDRLYDYLSVLDDYTKAYFNGVIDYNVGVYDSYAIEEIFARNNIKEWLNKKEFIDTVYEGELGTADPVSSRSLEPVLDKVNYLTSVAVTNKERLILLSMLSKHWEFKLFSNSTHKVLDNVIEEGTVDYNTEMPMVFKCSDINLNITIKSIKSGIPLRCMDIMGCGGFLLSNYQRDFDEHFVDGENAALFSSIEEAYDKFDYYISHDEERKKVAKKGYDTVKEYYNYPRQLRNALTLAGLDGLIQ